MLFRQEENLLKRGKSEERRRRKGAGTGGDPDAHATRILGREREREKTTIMRRPEINCNLDNKHVRLMWIDQNRKRSGRETEEEEEEKEEGYIFLRFYFGIEIREEIEKAKEKKMRRKMSNEVFARRFVR